MQEYSMSLQPLPPPPAPGPVFSILQLFSTVAVRLKFSSVSSTLRSFWRIRRASWAVHKYQSFSSSLSGAISCYFCGMHWRPDASLLCQHGGQPVPGTGIMHKSSLKALSKLLSDTTKLIKSFPLPAVTCEIQGSKKDLWLYNMQLKISADGHETERISQKNCMM